MYVCMYVCMYVYMYVYMYVCSKNERSQSKVSSDSDYPAY